MKKILVLLLLLSTSLLAQNNTSVSATKIQDLNGTLLGLGQVCFLGTDQNNQPISFGVGGGGQNMARPYCSAVVSGAFGPFNVPNPANTSPAGIFYRITITDSTTGQVVLLYKTVSFSGASFNFDSYSPVIGNLVPPSGGSVNGPLTVNGNLLITGSCTGCSSLTGAVVLSAIGTQTITQPNATGVSIVKSSGAQTATPFFKLSGTWTDPGAVTMIGFHNNVSFQPSGAASGTFYGSRFENLIDVDSGAMTGSIIGLTVFNRLSTSTALNNIGTTIGAQLFGFHNNTGGSAFGTITTSDAVTLRCADFSTVVITSGTITTCAGFEVFDSVTNGAVITNNIGGHIADLTSGTNDTNFCIGTCTTGDWSIYSNSAKASRFFGVISATGVGIGGVFTDDTVIVNNGVTSDLKALPNCSNGLTYATATNAFGCLGAGVSQPFADNVALVKGSVDATKTLTVNISSQTTGINGTFRTNFTTAKILDFPDAADTVMGKATVDTQTNKTIDAEGTGNVITIPFVFAIDLGTCQNATASANVDLPTTNAPVAGCLTGTNTQQGTLDFADSANTTFQTSFPLADDWAGQIDFDIYWLVTASGGSNAVKWTVATACSASAATYDTAFNAAQTITTNVGSNNNVTISSQASITISGCNPGNILHVKIGRDVTDTFTGTARGLKARFKVRRAI